MGAATKGKRAVKRARKSKAQATSAVEEEAAAAESCGGGEEEWGWDAAEVAESILCRSIDHKHVR